MTENNFNFTNGVSYDVWYETKRLIDQLKKENEELKAENEEVNDRMADVIYRATGGRLSYSNYTLEAIEQAFNDQLEILSDQKVEEETKELNQKLYLTQNEIHFKTEYIQEQRDIIKKLEQECEELKSESFTRESLISMQEKDIDRYRKALEEIEKVCLDFADGTVLRYDTLDDILDIINKVKDGNNE